MYQARKEFNELAERKLPEVGVDITDPLQAEMDAQYEKCV